MFNDYQLGLRPHWYSGGEWHCGFAQAVSKQEYKQATKALKAGRINDPLRISIANRPAPVMVQKDKYHDRTKGI
jgi:hypothetical protein